MIVWQRLGSTWKGNVEEVHRCVFAQTRELCHHQRSGGAAPAPSLLALIDQCFDQPWLHDLSSLLVLIHLLSTVTPLVSSHAVDLGPRHAQLLSLPSGGGDLQKPSVLKNSQPSKVLFLCRVVMKNSVSVLLKPGAINVLLLISWELLLLIWLATW